MFGAKNKTFSAQIYPKMVKQVNNNRPKPSLRLPQIPHKAVLGCKVENSPFIVVAIWRNTDREQTYNED